MSANTWITTFVNALLGALVGMFLLLPLGLVVAAQVIFSLRNSSPFKGRFDRALASFLTTP